MKAQIPTPWDEVALADFGEIVGGGTPSRATPSFWNGTIPWVTPSEITALPGKYIRDTAEKITSDGLAGSAAKLLPAGSVVVTTRATLGETAIAAVPLTTNQGFKSVIPNAETDSLFGYYRIQTLKSEMVRLASGTTFLEISKSDFSRIRARRPKLPEQTRIAAVLDTVDEAIAKTEAVIEKLRQVRAGLLHDLLTRGLDAKGQLRDPIAHPDQFQPSPLGQIPREWGAEKLDDLVRIIDCKHYTPKFVKEGKAFIRPRNVKPEGLNFSDVDHVSAEDFALLTDKHVPKLGDIVFSRNATFGVACYVDRPVPFAIGQDTVVMTEKAANTHFIYFVLRSSVVEAQVMRVSTGSTFGRINLAFIRSLLLPRPEPEEQEAIVERLVAFDQQTKLEEAELTKLRLLKSGLMTDLLSGRVRVPETLVTPP
jgi:type I restriction enzyme S subunit